jgi:hypothetical protein
MSDEFSRRVSATAVDQNHQRIAGAVFEWFVNGIPGGGGNSAGGFSSYEVLDPGVKISVSATVDGITQGPVKLDAAAKEYEFRFTDIVVNPLWRQIFMKHFPAIVGIVFIFIALTLVFVFPNPQPLQKHLILAVFALGGGGFGGEIAGFLNANLTLSSKLTITAGGAAAIFVLLYFFFPAGSN